MATGKSRRRKQRISERHFFSHNGRSALYPHRRASWLSHRDLEQGRRSPQWETVIALSAALGVDCTAFLERPPAQDKPGRGRPAKAKPEATEQEPKKTRGRPRKGEAESAGQGKNRGKRS